MDAFHGSRVTRDRGSREIISAVPRSFHDAQSLLGSEKERVREEGRRDFSRPLYENARGKGTVPYRVSARDPH